MNAAPTPSPLIDKKLAGDIRCIIVTLILTALPIIATLLVAAGSHR